MSRADVKGPAGSTGGAFDLCALGRIRTCNLLIRSQMLYPLSYECLFCFLAVPCPSGPLAATGRTLHDCRSHVKSVCHSPCDLRKHPSERGDNDEAPVARTGASVILRGGGGI